MSPHADPQPTADSYIEDVASALNWGAILLFVLFLMGIIGSAWPVRLIDPLWLQSVGDKLLASGPIAMVGAVLLLLAKILDPQSAPIGNRVTLLRRLSFWIAFGFLLLIPLQIYSGISLLRQFRANDTRELNAYIATTRAIESARSYDDILKAMRLLPGQAPALPASIDVPLEVVKTKLSNDLNPFIKRYQNSSDALGMKRLNDWFVQLARNVIAALLLFFSFAAIGKRFAYQPTLLQSVLSGRLLSAFGSRRHQAPPEMDAAMRMMMPDDSESRP
ncbi:hypothetical protein [Cyanobium sp. N5-Cardenillas]|uniref:hypothetical protein n=1 Tax=Cyanobium sp. N5-Cardenillas TaxID=2823720 RepID=UPI0020CF13EF|nr:hypothetical protein [Cyanobium sp. N5-Cardenillas]MCP9785411.1 hypothetical protein [Cyanobium sp. N5-Cardenillas]